MKNKRPFPTPKKSGDLRPIKRNSPNYSDSKKSNKEDHVDKAKSTVVDISSVIDPSVHTPSFTTDRLPELLSPAGSLDSLRAAINAGADAVYFGGGGFNARINADNFTNDKIKYAIELLHDNGKKAYITLNTLVCDRQIKEYLEFAEFLYRAGADALITADLGGAGVIHRVIPEFELHASTQMSGHNTEAAFFLQKLGFSRMVCAREMPKEDIAEFVRNSPIEAEVFVHGALCVCHSGQCLFSSLVGGRSGNRGECAQPCRLPYNTDHGKQKYPLSLKDLSLAEHISFLADAGVRSLKIEGRMKSPEYVYGVTKAFRTLLDCSSDATPEELARLAHIFSRGGFCDGYFEKKIDTSMLGIRSDADKQNARSVISSAPESITDVKKKKIPLSVRAVIKPNEPASLELEADGSTVCVYGDIPQPALNAPLTFENVKKSLTKFGDTEFYSESFTLDLKEGLMLPVSALNKLRRSGAESLSALIVKRKSEKVAKRSGEVLAYSPVSASSPKMSRKSARFYSSDQIPEAAFEYFDIIYLPADRFDSSANGVIIPPVIFDSERKKVEAMLSEAALKGAEYALVGNIGALELAKKFSLIPIADLRLNACNCESVAQLEKCGFEEIILSPELTLPQIRDIKGNTSCTVYGRIPLMLLEKCVIKEITDCDVCRNGKAELRDRYNVSFPVLREPPHRNIIYNSLPTYMADRQEELRKANISNMHFIFSVESKEECEKIIYAYKKGLPCPLCKKVRRI